MILQIFIASCLAVAYHGSLLDVVMLAEAIGCGLISLLLALVLRYTTFMGKIEQSLLDIINIYNISVFVLTLLTMLNSSAFEDDSAARGLTQAQNKLSLKGTANRCRLFVLLQPCLISVRYLTAEWATVKSNVS